MPADEAEAARATPPSSAAAASSPGPSRVQKNGRRQSTRQAAPENIAKALDSMPAFETQQQIGTGASGSMSPYPSQTPTPSGSYTPVTGGFNPSTTFMAQHPVTTNGDAPPQGAGCCSSKPQPPQPTQSQGSCCEKTNSPLGNSQNIESNFKQRGQSYPAQLNGYAYPSVPSVTQSPLWQDYPTGQGHLMRPFPISQPQAQQPVYFSEYAADVPSTPSMGFQQQSHHDLGFTQPTMPQLLASNSQFPYTSQQAFGTETHACNCGDDCQCLGCATHPFNKTTRQHVQEMGLLVSLDGDDLGAKSYGNSPYPSQMNTNLLDYSFPGLGNPIENGIQQSTMHPYSDPTATPNINNGYSSPVGYTSGQPLMQPSEYYTLEYPVGLPNPCTDITGSCQCGNDCSCVGCLTHSGHNGVALEPPTAEDTASGTGHPPASEQPNSGLSQIPVLDDLSVPSTSPRGIEP